MSDVKVKPSPVWLQIELTKQGIRPINNIVDQTNYYMILTGQPIHAYDYDKVKALCDGNGVRLTIRHPKEGEQITILGGKTIAPRHEAMMVAADHQLICVGGAIGGASTEVDENTKSIIIEAANWDMYSMRRTSMEHGIFTDAVTRFTKGQSPLQNKAIVAKIVDAIRKTAGGKVASELVDDNHLDAEVMERGSLHPPVEVTAAFINSRLGLELNGAMIMTLLKNVEFDVEVVPFAKFKVKAPFWRTDIKIPEDVVEEIGRLHGYDHLPVELPARDITPAAKNDMLELKTRVRETLSKAGANEVLTYNFVHGNLLDKVGQSGSQAFRLSNALSPDLQYYRLSLTQNLLDKIHPNAKAGHDQFALFEIGKAHIKDAMEDGLPKEFARVALVFAANTKAAETYSGAPYYQARKYLMALLSSVGMAAGVALTPLSADDADPAATYYEPGRAATIKVGDTVVGRIGEYKAPVRKALKLPDFCAGFELGLQPLLERSQPASYVALPRFPKVEQDICLKVPAELPYAELFQFVWDHLDEHRPDQTYHDLSPVDIYRRDDDQAHKQITLRLHIASYERTLTDEEVNNLLDRIASAAHEKFGAERV